MLAISIRETTFLNDADSIVDLFVFLFVLVSTLRAGAQHATIDSSITKMYSANSSQWTAMRKSDPQSFHMDPDGVRWYWKEFGSAAHGPTHHGMEEDATADRRTARKARVCPHSHMIDQQSPERIGWRSCGGHGSDSAAPRCHACLGSNSVPPDPVHRCCATRPSEDRMIAASFDRPSDAPSPQHGTNRWGETAHLAWRASRVLCVYCVCQCVSVQSVECALFLWLCCLGMKYWSKLYTKMVSATSRKIKCTAQENCITKLDNIGFYCDEKGNMHTLVELLRLRNRESNRCGLLHVTQETHSGLLSALKIFPSLTNIPARSFPRRRRTPLRSKGDHWNKNNRN